MAKKGKINIGVIGTGWVTSTYHLPCLSKIENANIGAICDIDAERIEKAAKEYKIKEKFSDYREMLKIVDIDAVYVTTRPDVISRIVIDCLNAGKHVFLEKPPGVNLVECKKMLKAADKNKRITMVGFNRRYSPIYLKAREIVEKSGGITQVVGEFHKNLFNKGEYYGISVLRSDIIHMLDVVRWLGGEPVKVFKIIDKFLTDWRSGFNALIKFKNGITGALLSNYVSGTRYERYEIHGREIMVELMPPKYLKVFASRKETIINSKDLTGTDDDKVNYGFMGENRCFVDCVLNNKKPVTSLDDSVITMKLIEMIERQ